MKAFEAWCVWAVLSFGAGPIGGQSSGADVSVPGVFSALEGAWSGTGTLMGRPGSFEMEWTSRDGGFVELRFANSFVDATGRITPVLDARAIYRPLGATAVGVWIDSRPQRIELDAVLTDSTVTTEWTAPEERGRTEYRLEQGGVTVRDYVESDGRMRLFAEARYGRAGSVREQPGYSAAAAAYAETGGHEQTRFRSP